MGFKVKTVDKLERVQGGPLVKYQATVTYSNGVKDITEMIISQPINPHNRTDKEVNDFLKASIHEAIEAGITALDVQVVKDLEMKTVKSTIVDALTSAGLTVALLLCLLLAPVLSYAGDLEPNWEAWQALGENITELGLAGSTHEVGTIDMADYYVVQIAVNWDENGDNPADTAGVSLYFTSGTTTGYIPDVTYEIAAADYAKHYNVADGSGVTKAFPNFENVAQVTVGIVKQTTVDANNVFNVYYRRMKGKYTD